MSSDSVWVCKPDGTMQCQEDAATPLEVDRALLESLIGPDNILAQEKRSHSVPTQCGLPTGEMNAFEISEFGAWLLFHGFPGPMGFSKCPEAEPDTGVETVSEVKHFSEALQVSGASSVKRSPALVKELIGYTLRAYQRGDPVTDDYQPTRVNIVLDSDQQIIDIWVG